MEQRYFLRERQRHIHVVLDQQNCHVTRNTGEQVLNIAPFGARQPGIVGRPWRRKGAPAGQPVAEAIPRRQPSGPVVARGTGEFSRLTVAVPLSCR